MRIPSRRMTTAKAAWASKVAACYAWVHFFVGVRTVTVMGPTGAGSYQRAGSGALIVYMPPLMVMS